MITFDQRWHGRGIRSPRFRFTECAEDAIAVMDVLGVERAVLAGYSMGARSPSSPGVRIPIGSPAWCSARRRATSGAPA